MRFLQNDYFEQRTDIADHTSLIEATSGSDSIPDERMLDLALNNLFQSFDRKELYPSIYAKVVQLCFGLVKNHAIVYENKKI